MTRLLRRLAGAIMLAVLAGCYAPVSTALPTSPPALGTGQWGVGLQVEGPVLDMLDTVATAPEPANPNKYPTVGLPVFGFQLGTGITDTLDLEAGTDGAVYGVLPLPHGAWLGLRHQTLTTPHLDLGLTVRAGYAGFLASSDTIEYEGSTVGVARGTAAVSARLKSLGRFQPGLALAVHPMWVMPEIQGAQVDDFFGLAISATLGVRYRTLAPFVNLGVLTSDNARGTSLNLSAGLAVFL